MAGQKIKTYLWFDHGKAEEAARYYTSIFPDSKVIDTNPMITTFQLGGQEILALNGGPQFKFNESFSLFVSCKDQAEVDQYWSKLVGDGGEESQCGWLKDKYGLSWQIIPNRLMELLGHSDRERADRATQAMLKMQKIDVATLERAFNGNG